MIFVVCRGLIEACFTSCCLVVVFRSRLTYLLSKQLHEHTSVNNPLVSNLPATLFVFLLLHQDLLCSFDSMCIYCTYLEDLTLSVASWICSLPLFCHFSSCRCVWLLAGSPACQMPGFLHWGRIFGFSPHGGDSLHRWGEIWHGAVDRHIPCANLTKL